MPRLRICGEPTVRDASASAGSVAATSPVIRSAYVTPAPMRTRPSACSTPRSSGTSDRSSTATGSSRPKLISTMTSVPPCSTVASGCSARMASASSREVGRRTSIGGFLQPGDRRVSVVATVPPSGVIGRERELHEIQTFLAAAPSPRALLVEGDPGAGKTTLLRAAAESDGERTLMACWPAEAESTLPFVSLADLSDRTSRPPCPDLPRPQRRALAAAILLDDDDAGGPGVHAIGAAS